MVNFGRFVCVAVPFALTLAALVAILVAALAGVADKSLYMFQVNTTALSISPASISSLINKVTTRDPQTVGFHDEAAKAATSDSSSSKTSNITAADLGLYNLYDVNLWGYCYTPQNGSRACTQAQFNWAENALNTTKNNVNSLITVSGQNITLPTELTTAITTFGTVARWTQITFIIAIISLGIELFMGIFANCSRIFSCITFIIAGLATVAVCTAASLATAMSVVVVGAVEGSAKWYGVSAEFNTRFLAAVWIGAAFSIAAGFFWLFTCCCCAPDHSSRRSRKRGLENEKLIPNGSYQPIHDDHGYNNGFNNRHSGQQYGYTNAHAAPRRDMAYEPYSHANV